MPVPAAAAGKVAVSAGRAEFKIGGAHAVVLAVIAGIALAFVWVGVRKSPSGGLKVPARATEDVPPFTPPPGTPALGTFDHVGAVVVSPHRYPAGCGGEISNLIHYGHASIRLPHSKDIDWLTQPPSEATL
jgi:hypothetical protein